MRWLTLENILVLHERVVDRTGGATGIRDQAGLESANAQPQATFGGELLHAELCDQAAALGFSLIGNHPFVDGNKRIGHAAMTLTSTPTSMNRKRSSSASPPVSGPENASPTGCARRSSPSTSQTTHNIDASMRRGEPMFGSPRRTFSRNCRVTGITASQGKAL